jgi:purine nucleosidase
MTWKILLDTDIGSDIDDAVALAYLLAQPQCDLLGITTVSGEPEKRAALASAICRAAGKEIPIYPGLADPFRRKQWQPVCQQAEALSGWPHQTEFPNGQAVDFLRETIRAHPGEVVLLTIGPLTNIATLFQTDPGIPALLKGLVSMCGMFTRKWGGVGPLEWNAMLDPQATASMYRNAPAGSRSIGLDVTLQVKMPAAEVRERFQTPRLLPVRDFAEVWFRQRKEITFHDPLAAATIFDPSICHFERGRVDVNLTSKLLAGRTIWKPAADGPHEVALNVDPQRFFDHYFSLFR